MIAGFFGLGAVAVAKPKEEGYDGIPHNKFVAALRYMADTIPQGNAVMLYPCGCSASGNEPPESMRFGIFLPRYCPTHDREAKRENECTVVRGTRLIHVEEAAALQSGMALGRRPTANFQFQDSEIVKLLDAYYPEVGRDA